MKKVGIVTLSSNNNFGNKLQNYALAKEIEKLNCNVETIWINSLYDGNIITSTLRFLRNELMPKRYIVRRRERKFKVFDQRYIKYNRRKYFFFSNFTKFEKEYDKFVVGSDQVWNTNVNRNVNIYFLKGIPYKKNIAYAASFGISEIKEDNKRKQYKKGINNIKNISVREDAGKDIIENITKRKDIEVLIDPTMLLDVEEWRKIEKKPENFKNEKYILNYFLGDFSIEIKKEINRIAKENNCKVINILDENDDMYISGPSEFLYLERNAFLICTDSFHSCVFSILFDRPFIVFDRKGGKNSMGSRIDTLINKFKLKNRKYNGEKIIRENLEHNYFETYEILEKEREKSIKFLKNALEIGE